MLCGPSPDGESTVLDASQPHLGQRALPVHSVLFLLLRDMENTACASAQPPQGPDVPLIALRMFCYFFIMTEAVLGAPHCPPSPLGLPCPAPSKGRARSLPWAAVCPGPSPALRPGLGPHPAGQSRSHWGEPEGTRQSPGRPSGTQMERHGLVLLF